MKYKRIIIFFPFFNKGGLETVSNTILNKFKKFKFEIYFITYQKSSFLKFKNSNVKIICPNNRNSKHLSKFQKLISCANILIKILKNDDPLNSIVFSLQNSAISILISKYYKYKIVVKNAAPVEALFYSKNILKQIVVFIFKILTYNLADRIIVNSRANKNSLSKFILNKKKIYKIYNPINFSKIKLRRKKRQILTVSRLTYEKGIHILIKSLKRIDDKKIKLIILGDGPYKQNLINLAKSLKIQNRVKFLGWVVNPNRYYAESSIFILPTFFEGFGNVLVEAMHHNLICISTLKSGGPEEILGNGNYGFLVKRKNIDELTNKINLCLNNRKLTNNKINNAKKSLYRFDTNLIINKYLKVLSI